MLKGFITSFGHAVRGMRALWKHEKSFRLETVIGLFVVALTWALHFSLLESLLILFAILMVIGAEIINTIIERTLDLIEPNHHPGVGMIKDMMAAAVVVSTTAAALIGLFTSLYHFRP